jgi:DNA-binding transcriptional LysR family regulator
MDVPRLEAFLEVARLGSMRSASRTLHLGQPALSARIATLEDEVGARLFERTKRGVRLTLAGRALLPHAERALDAIDAGRSAISQVEQGDEGELVVAAASAITASVVPELVARFRRFHPGVHLYVHTGTAERILELVAFGSAQLGLIRETRPLRDPRLRGDDYALTQALLREASVSPYGVIEVDSVDTARRLVALGLGVALLPSTAAAPEIEAGRLAPVGLQDVPHIRSIVVAVERAEGSAWAPVTTLRRLLGDVAAFVPGAGAVHG